MSFEGFENRYKTAVTFAVGRELTMGEKIKKIALVTNFNIYEKAGAAMAVAHKLHECGCEFFVSSYNKDKVSRMNKSGMKITYMPLAEAYAEADCAIVLGGDGTILDAARHSAPLGKPILGINLGRIGYMAELEQGEFDLIPRICDGDYEIDERSMLNVEIIDCDGRVRAESFALNDAAITNGTVARIVEIELFEGEESIAKYRSDGIIVATPTGSTAYSMSAGGAIVDPRLHCFCVTPICPFSLSSKPLVFPDSTALSVKNISHREKMMYLTMDGKANFEVYRGEQVRFTRSPLRARLIRLKPSSFYTKLRHKMTEN